MTCWPPFFAAKEQGIGAILRLQWRTFAADIRRCVYKNSNRRNDVRHYRLSSFVTFSTCRLSSNLAYITSVFIGYIGTDSIGSLIKRFAAKSRSRMVEINNQRKAFPDMLAWSEGPITDVRNQKSWL